MKLTPEQEEAIEQQVYASGIEIESLREDIVDHLCCVVESNLGKGQSFQQVLNEAITDLAPNGLADIQTQTIFFLNAKRILIMKKMLYLTGFIGAVALTAGTLFKLLHWPYGFELFTLGFLTLLLVFIPLLAFNRYKVALAKAYTERMKIILGAASAIITGLAGLFKVLHLMGANMLLILGALVFAFGFLPFLFFTMYKKSVA